MARTLDGSADYFFDSGTISTFRNPPSSMFCWGKFDTTGTTMAFMHCVDDTTNVYAGLWFYKDASENLFARARGNSSSPTASCQIGTSISTGTWYAMGMTLTNSGSSYTSTGWLNGTKGTADTQTFGSTNARDEFALGGFTNGSVTNLLDGTIAHCAGWNVALRDSEMEALCHGYAPSRIRPQSLAFYCPMLETAATADAQDRKGNMSFTATSSPGLAADHPPVMMG